MARLPVSGDDEGIWGDVLNNFLSQSLTGAGALKSNTVGSAQLQADSVGAAAVADAALPQAKVQNLTTSLAAKANHTTTITGGSGLNGGGDLSANRVISVDFGTTAGTVAEGDHTHPSPPATGIYPISAYGFFTASAAVESCLGSGTNASLFAARVFVPAGNPIIAIGALVRSVGTLGAGGENGFAIYSDSGALLAASVSDDNLWTTAGWRTKTFAAPIAAAANDRFVYACQLVNGYSVSPQIVYNVMSSSPGINGGGYGVPNHRRSFYDNGVTSWPASIDPLTYGSDPGGYLPLVALA